MPEMPIGEDELDRFLEDLTAGRPATPGYDIAPDVIATVLAARVMATAPVPESMSDRVTAALADEIARLSDPIHHQSWRHGLGALPADQQVFTPNGHGPARSDAQLAPIAPPAPWRWAMAQAATAALIVVTIVAGVATVLPRARERIEIVSAPVIAPPIRTDPAELLWQTRGGPTVFPLTDPYHLALDGDGNLWVPDPWTNQFQIFAPDGSFLGAWGRRGNADGEFYFFNIGTTLGPGAGAAAFDAAGNLYVLDPGNHRIQKFGEDLEFVTAWGGQGEDDGQFAALTDIDVDRRGRVYVLDAERAQVQVFDGDGQFLTKWGSEGLKVGELRTPYGLAIDRLGNVYIADSGNHRVQKFGPEGEFLEAWGGSGTAPGQFRTPDDVAVDTQGRIFVTDSSNSRIQVLDENGRVLAIWGGEGPNPGQFKAPSGIAVDSFGNVYVSEGGNDRVQKFRFLPTLDP
jgi:DNA-binding beta-propeller fold protein YncE